MSATELEWRALRQVLGGEVAKSAGVYFEHGHLVPDDLTRVFDRLVWAGLVTVADGDPVWALRGLSLTDAGRARYASLDEPRRSPLPVPPPEHGTQTQEGPW